MARRPFQHPEAGRLAGLQGHPGSLHRGGGVTVPRKQQKPRQRKAHCGQKRAQRFFGRTRIWTWETDREIGSPDQNAVAVTRTIKGWEPLEPKVANAVTRHRNSWIVCVRALC